MISPSLPDVNKEHFLLGLPMLTSVQMSGEMAQGSSCNVNSGPPTLPRAAVFMQYLAPVPAEIAEILPGEHRRLRGPSRDSGSQPGPERGNMIPPKSATTPCCCIGPLGDGLRLRLSLAPWTVNSQAVWACLRDQFTAFES